MTLKALVISLIILINIILDILVITNLLKNSVDCVASRKSSFGFSNIFSA